MDGRYQTGNRVTKESGPALLGGGAELNAVNGVLRRTTPERGTLLVGEPGIGKTTIWEVGIAAAQTQGMLVLTSRAAAEADFSFTALADLLDGLGPDVLGTLPAPRVSRR